MLLLRAISHLPLSFLYVLSDMLYVFVFYVIKYRKKLVMTNLERSFPAIPRKQLLAIRKKFYKNLCDYAVEVIKLYSISSAELSMRTRFINPAIVRAYKEKYGGVLILAAHQFNWEWLVAVSPLNLSIPIDFIYQPLNSPFFDKLLLALRSRFGAFGIRRDEVARKSVQRKDLFRGIAMVADQYPGWKTDKYYHTTFLQQETVFFEAAQSLAMLLKIPVVFVDVRKARRGFYEVTFKLIAEPPYTKQETDIMKKYVAEVEALVHERPAEWLWSHNRWKKRHLKKQAN